MHNIIKLYIIILVIKKLARIPLGGSYLINIFRRLAPKNTTAT